MTKPFGIVHILGLHDDTGTWEYLTEEQYQSLKPIVGKALPTMAISKVKIDSDGVPTRAKYRIVVLSNLDPYNWSNSDCYAPVLSSWELQLLICYSHTNESHPEIR